MLLNCTNHPYDIWSESMKEAAERQYGEVVDLLFPKIDPAWRDAEIRREVDRYVSRIHTFQADAVLAAGEFTFLFMLVDKLLADGTEVICSCSERKTEEIKKPDGSNEKKSVFFFECFRPYTRYGSKEETHG